MTSDPVITRDDDLLVCCPAEALPEPGALDLGRTRLRAEGASLGAPFVLCDTFDGQVAGGGRLLLRTGGTLRLIGPERVPGQPDAVPDFLAAMPAGAVTEALAGRVSPLRRLLGVAGGRMRTHRLSLANARDQPRGTGEFWRLETGHGAVSVLVLRGLAAHPKTRARVLRRIADQLSGQAFDLLEASARLRGVPRAALGKPRTEIAPDATAFDAAVTLIRAQLAQARRLEAGTLADLDTEFLHDYRVALRRARSVLSLFKGVFEAEQTAELKTGVRALMAPTGELRDLDVLQLDLKDHEALLPEDHHAGLRALGARIARDRAEAQARFADWLKGARYAAERERLERLFDRPKRLSGGPRARKHALSYARRLIWKRYRKVCAIAAGIDTAPEARVHALRIHCKKLRYLMEFFAPLFGDDIKPLVKALKRLQDSLGRFNDCVVQQAALAEIAARTDPAEGPEEAAIHAAIGALRKALRRVQQEERARIAGAFEAFDSHKTQARFKSLFKRR